MINGQPVETFSSVSTENSQKGEISDLSLEQVEIKREKSNFSVAPSVALGDREKPQRKATDLINRKILISLI